MSALSVADSLVRDTAALLIIKATVVLALASAVAAIATTFSAARRHTLWLVALSSCVLLALSSPVAPAILIHAPAFGRSTRSAISPATVGGPAASAVAPIVDAPRETGRSANSQTPGRRPTESTRPLPTHPLLAIWIAGCLVLLAREAIMWVLAVRLARRAIVATDRDTTSALTDAAAAVGLTRRIVPAYSRNVQSPIAFGIATPVVLLPTEATEWSAARRRAVLVHEAAHVLRGDCVAQTIGRVACAIFWFHPLAWRVFRHLRNDAERAADDCVLRSGIPALEYASHLLDVARQARDTRLNIVAVGLVTQTQLERRFMSLFDNTRSRAAVTSHGRAATMAFSLAVIGPVASLRVVEPVPSPRTSVSETLSLRSTIATSNLAAERRFPEISPVARLAVTNVHETSIVSRVVAPAVGGSQLPPELARQDLPPIAVMSSAPRRAGTHPDFSGTWRSDTAWVHTAEFVYLVTDSLRIRQIDDALSFESHGHLVTGPWPHQLLPTHNLLATITFDGAVNTGVVVTGNTPTNVSGEAVWIGDTLVVTSQAHGGNQDLFTIERMTLSADGTTLTTTNRSFVNGKDRWGLLTTTARRILP